MFLTTETSIPGSVHYTPIRVIHGAICSDASGAGFWGASEKKAMNQADILLEQALGILANAASDLRADGVLGIHHNIAMYGGTLYVTIMGTAIKF
jgi:uncharacterized protein YbjQ (UPF0145 family)